MAAPELPAADLRVAMQVVGTGRRVEIFAATEAGKACLRNVVH
jgi:hypothetical protein